MTRSKDKCFVCNEDLKIKNIISCRGYKYIFCSKCNGASLHPRLKVLKVSKKKYNTKKYFTWVIESKLRKYVNKLKLSENYSEWVSKSLHDKKKAKVLDVGAGIPTFVLQMKELNFNAYALEPSKEQSQIIASYIGKGKVYNSFFESSKVKENYFDAITFWHVLEHVHDLEKVIKKANEVLKRGGSIFLEVPNAKSLTWSLFGDSYELLAVPEHTLYFSEESLRYTFTRHGFEIKEVSYPLKYISVFSLSLSRKFKTQILYYLSLPLSLILNPLMVYAKRSEVLRIHLAKPTS